MHPCKMCFFCQLVAHGYLMQSVNAWRGHCSVASGWRHGDWARNSVAKYEMLLLPHLKLPPTHFPSPYPSARLFRSEASFRCCVPQIRINQSSFTAVSQSVNGVVGVVQSQRGEEKSHRGEGRTGFNSILRTWIKKKGVNGDQCLNFSNRTNLSMN